MNLKYWRSLLVFCSALLVISSHPVNALAAVEEAAPAATLEREIKFKEGDPTPEFDRTIIEEDGSEYRLVSVDDPIDDPSYIPNSKQYTQQKTIDIPKEDINKLNKYFPARVYIDDGYFSGYIGLAADPYDTINIYESFTGQVDKEHKIENLPDNDVSRLPKQKDFEVRSDAAHNATKKATLKLLSVEYEITGKTSLGLPNKYTAHLVFRGQESWLDIHHYNVTAGYEGEVLSTERHYVVRAQYELIEKPKPALPLTLVSEPIPPLAINEPEVPQLAQSIPLLAYVAGGLIIISALGLLVLWILMLRKNAALIRTIGDRQRVLARRRLNVVDGKAIFVVPNNIQVFSSANHAIELKPTLANTKGILVVEWQGKTIARDLLQPRVEIGISSIKDEAVLAAITEALIEEEIIELDGPDDEAGVMEAASAAEAAEPTGEESR
jgi:hypothetical protein